MPEKQSTGESLKPLAQAVRPLNDAFRIILIYLAMGMLWIFFSDRLLSLLVHDMAAYEQAQLFKGWFYIVLSASIFFLILYGKLRLIERSAVQITVDNQRLHELAYYDQLTQLPNRAMLMEQGAELLQVAAASRLKAALLFLDIDNFKHINETMTHNAGDALLCHLASQLLIACSPQNHVYRLGGDEFAVLVMNPSVDADFAQLCVALKQRLGEPWLYQGNQFHMTVSIGLAVYPDHGDSIDSLCQNADAALSHVKDHGRNGVAAFSEDMQAASWTYLKLFNGLQKTIAAEGFSLHYQPIINLRTRQVECCEALIRWPDPQREFIPPLEFIPFSEGTGQIFPITEWVLRQTCRFLQSGAERSLPVTAVTINLSTVVLRHAGFCSMIEKIERELVCSPGTLQFEITESAAVQDVEQAVSVITWLRSRGYKILLDDFGTGYSSLTYLQTLPIDIVKIDKNFTRDIATQPDHQRMFRSIVDLAHQIGLQILAEGVETPEQLDIVIASGCDFGQGYFFARPMSEETLAAWADQSPYCRSGQ